MLALLYLVLFSMPCGVKNALRLTSSQMNDGLHSLVHRVAKKTGTYFEMGTDGHRFVCFQIGIINS